MQALPTREEQEWLTQNVAELVTAQGVEPWLHAPIVEPTEEYFPEAEGSAAYLLDRVTRRLMQYAGLPRLDVRFHLLWEDDDDEVANAQELGEGTSCQTAACYFGIENDCCQFGLNEAVTADAEQLAGLMAHEVAHAYRHFHGLARDSEAEEFLTDITTVYLGFGILVANNAQRFRTGGEVVGGWSMHEWRLERVGYLPPQAFTFLLAMQTSLRNLEPREHTRFASLLEPGQADYYRAAVKHLAAQKGESEADPSQIGARVRAQSRSVREILEPLPDFEPWETSDPEATPGDNVDHPVFRVRRDRKTIFGLALGAALGIVALVTMPDSGAVLWVTALTLTGVATGLVLGHQSARDVCSDPVCATVLEPQVRTCPGCGGTVAGRIRSHGERGEAEERVLESWGWLDDEHDDEYDDEAPRK